MSGSYAAGPSLGWRTCSALVSMRSTTSITNQARCPSASHSRIETGVRNCWSRIRRCSGRPYLSLSTDRCMEVGVTTAEPSDEALAELEALTREIAGLGFVLSGTVTERYTRCTSKNCRCRADPPPRPLPGLDPQGGGQDRHQPAVPRAVRALPA